MAKAKTVFVCQSCGSQSPQWLGRCPSCGEWNSYVEEVQTKEEKAGVVPKSPEKTGKPQPIKEINLKQEPRIPIPDVELHRVLGGGLVPGSITLIGGEPGIGKSTLLLQIALRLPEFKVLYISGEESEQQIRLRAERIGIPEADVYILTETSTENIFRQIEVLKPGLVIVDSIQTLHTPMIESSPGSISQIRECTSELMRFAKESNTPVFLIGHITKEGNLAGPKVLEHMVDTVLQFEGDRHHLYRLLRAAKNRFGSTNELGIYEMRGTGLREVPNPSELLVSNQDPSLSGIAIAAMVEGMRPMLIETQALVSTAAYGTPQRTSTGFDLRRLNMLLAVLEKRCGFRLGSSDVFLNMAGGIKVDDPAIDLAVVCAILSSAEDLAVPPEICFAGEVGLSGEIRPVGRIEQRIGEAEKLGFKKIFVAGQQRKEFKGRGRGIQVAPVEKVEQVLSQVFG